MCVLSVFLISLWFVQGNTFQKALWNFHCCVSRAIMAYLEKLTASNPHIFRNILRCNVQQTTKVYCGSRDIMFDASRLKLNASNRHMDHIPVYGRISTNTLSNIYTPGQS